MEFVIGVAIAVAIAGLIKVGKPNNPRQTPADDERKRKQSETDEVITVILPTINNDKS